MESQGETSGRRKKRPSNIQLSDSEDEVIAPRSSRQTNGNGNVSKRQRLVPASSDIEDDVADEEAGSQVNGTQRAARKGKGRAHVNGNGHVSDEGAEEPNGYHDEDDDEDAPPPPPAPMPQLYERHDDGYVTGSITRIKLIDFMTYDFVEFNPGPHLNMILGPNGTGKSTIAAGIAIGLGFKPEVMGRASDIQSYVKQGKEEAWTELEVRGKRGKRNHVIWRRFGKDGRSEWRLNGTSTKRKDILELVAKFGIQANNLCCFLAQDRVSEFAKMAPPLTLKETMRAAGNPSLTEWHEHLVKKGQEKKLLDERLEDNVTRRDQVQAQVQTLEPDVEHFENRQNQELQRDILTIWVDYCRAAELDTLAREAVGEVTRITEQIKAVNRKNRPMRELLADETDKVTKAADKVEKAEEWLSTTNRGIRQERGKLADKMGNFTDIDDQLAQAKRKIARSAKTKADLEARRDEALARLEVPRETLQAESQKLSQQKREGDRQKREIDHKRRDLVGQRLDKEREVKDIGRGIDDKMDKLKKLNSIEKVRTEAAIQMNGSIGVGLDFIERHGAQLAESVAIPAAISLHIPDQRFAAQIEQALPFAQLSTFVCQNKPDYDKLMQLNNTRYEGRIMSDGRRINGGLAQLHLATARATKENTEPRPLCSPERMHQLGLDGCASDFVEAEPVMIAWLNEQCSFNRIAITSRPMIDINIDAVNREGFVQIISRDESLRITKSRYGRRENLLNSKALTPARLFRIMVDQTAVNKLNEEIADLKRRKVDFEKPWQDLGDKIRKVDDEVAKINGRLEDLEKQVTEAQKKVKDWDRCQAQIDHFRKELERLAAQPSLAEEQDRLQAEKLAAALKCIPHISTLATYHEGGNTYVADAVTATLLKTQASTNRTAIDKKYESRVREASDLARRKERAIEKKNALRIQLEAKTKQVQDIAQDSQTPRPVRHALIDRVKDPRYKGQSVEDAQAELAQVEAELEISQGINPQVIVRYKRLCKELDAVQKEVSIQESDLDKVKKSIDTILNKFEPALDSLVTTVSARFAAAFDRNGCAGDVRLDKAESGYDNWGLVPHVSFRDGEAMQPLTGSRQSGGERSYSTIMYLMALSAMARVPFSLVDEINQGMDQQAERTVFNQLVETTCAENAGQYFLITPKLLTGLTYHPKMKVLIVNNGYWLPDGSDKKQKFGDLRGALQRYKRSIAAH